MDEEDRTLSVPIFVTLAFIHRLSLLTICCVERSSTAHGRQGAHGSRKPCGHDVRKNNPNSKILVDGPIGVPGERGGRRDGKMSNRSRAGGDLNSENVSNHGMLVGVRMQAAGSMEYVIRGISLAEKQTT